MGVLRCVDLTVRYGDLLAVDAVDLQVSQSEVVAVLGPSGCGKSTLLRTIVGIERPTSGSVTFDGVDQARIPVHRRGFGLMFQDGQLFEHLDVQRNVAYGLRRAGLDRDAVRPRVAELLELVGLAGYERRSPTTLSGGERQRVALARALAPEPRLLLLDEPLSALDRSLRVRLAGDLRDILRRTATTAILVTHDHEEAFALADEVALMRAGRLIQQGKPRAVWSAPVDAEAALFLGYSRVLTGAQAATFAAAAGLALPGAAALALRPTAALVGAGPLSGEVVAVVPSVDEQRLVVRLGDATEIDAQAPLSAELTPGTPVRLSVDPAATAVLPEPASAG